MILLFTIAVSCVRSCPESVSLEKGVYLGHNVFKNSIKNGFSIICQGISQMIKAFTQAWLIS